MTVKEAVEQLAYGETFFLKGAYSGKILYHSRHNKKERLERFLDWDVHRECFFTDLYTPSQKYDKPYTFPIIGIWVSDYGRTEKVKTDALHSDSRSENADKLLFLRNWAI